MQQRTETRFCFYLASTMAWGRCASSSIVDPSAHLFGIDLRPTEASQDFAHQGKQVDQSERGCYRSQLLSADMLAQKCQNQMRVCQV